MQQVPIVECEIIQEFRAPNNKNGTLIFKTFKPQERVRGTVVNHGKTPLNYVPALKTLDGFIIPESHLNVLGAVNTEKKTASVQEAKEVTTNDYVSKENKGKAQKVGEALANGALVKMTQERSKYAVYGAMIGAGIGLGYAIYKGKSKLMFASVGAIAGAMGGNLYHKVTKK